MLTGQIDIYTNFSKKKKKKEKQGHFKTVTLLELQEE